MSGKYELKSCIREHTTQWLIALQGHYSFPHCAHSQFWQNSKAHLFFFFPVFTGEIARTNTIMLSRYMQVTTCTGTSVTQLTLNQKLFGIKSHSTPRTAAHRWGSTVASLASHFQLALWFQTLAKKLSQHSQHTEKLGSLQAYIFHKLVWEETRYCFLHRLLSPLLSWCGLDHTQTSPSPDRYKKVQILLFFSHFQLLGSHIWLLK